MKWCPICKSERICHKLFLSDDRYGYPGDFTLLRCQYCDHVFLEHEFTPEQLTELYSVYYPRSHFDSDSYKPHAETTGFSAWLAGARGAAFRWVPGAVRVLDVGCGFGETLGYHVARGCDVYGVEADENIRRVADRFGYKVHVGLFDAGLYEADFFDYVTMDQVFEHVVDPLGVLEGVARILKPGGVVVMSFPNARGWGARVFGRRWINWHAPYHLHFYSDRSLELLASRSGLKLIEDTTITPSSWLHFQWMHLITYPKPGESSKFWAGSACGNPVDFTMMQRLLIKFAGFFHSVKLNHLATRLFDALGIGDNRVVLLRKP